MKIVRSNPLPEKLTVVRSVGASVPASINSRIAMLSQLHGYPVPSHILAYARKYLAPSSLNTMKRGIATMRDCAKYAAEALATLRMARLDRYQLEPGDLGKWVAANASNHGFTHLSPEDLIFVAYLITSSEVQTNSWTLELHPLPAENMIAQFLELYQSVQTSLTPIKLELKTNTIGIVNPPSMPVYFLPSSDRDFGTIFDIALPQDKRRSLYSTINSLTSQAQIESIYELQGVIEREASIFALCDIRLIDHLLLLLLDTAIWGTFLTPRSKVDASQNDERARGLQAMAGYLQSLLLMPHFFRYEFFRTSYLKLEAWHGSLPSIPNHVIEDYNRLLAPYDFLGVTEDVKNLFSMYDISKDPNVDSSIHVLFEECFSLFGATEVLDGVKALPDVTQFMLSDLTYFKDPNNDSLLLSLPLARFNLLDDLSYHLARVDSYVTITRDAVRMITPSLSRFFNAEISSKLTSLNPKVPFKWHHQLAATPSSNKGTYPSVHHGKFAMKEWSPWATAAANRSLQTDQLFTFGNGNYYASKSLPTVSVDHHQAEQFRSAYSRTWRTLYPAGMMSGSGLRFKSSFYSNSLELETLFESLTGNHYETIRRLLANQTTASDFATYFSSFCLFYRKTKNMGAAVLIEGENTPYGLSYQDLEALQTFNVKKDLLVLPNTDVLVAFLKVVPMPSTTMKIGSLANNKPYYYFYGDGVQLSTDAGFVLGDSLLHMALRPLLSVPHPRPLAFDKLRVYSTDHVFMQMDPAATLDYIPTADETFTFPIKLQTWRGDKVYPLLDYFTLGEYCSAADYIAPSEGEESARETELIDKMNNELLELEKSSRLQEHLGDNDMIKLEPEIEAGVAKTGGPTAFGTTTPVNQKSTGKKKRASDHSDKEDTDSE